MLHYPKCTAIISENQASSSSHLVLLVIPKIVAVTTCGAVRGDKYGTTATLVLQHSLLLNTNVSLWNDEMSLSWFGGSYEIFQNILLELCYGIRVRNAWYLSFGVYASVGKKELGAVSIRKTVLPGMAIPMLKIRRPNGRLIFNMEIAIRR